MHSFTSTKTTLVLTFFILTNSSLAQVPKLINYQGLLLDPTTSEPVPDSSYAVEFAIYDQETGGSAVWSEIHDVVTENGLYAVLLGSLTPIADGVFDGTVKYLGIKVGSTPELTPRRRLVSVAYSLRSEESDKVDGQDASEFATKSELSNSDGTTPNIGSNQVSWDNLTDVPSGFADGTDDGGGGGDDFSNGGDAGGADRTLGNTDNFDLGFLTNNITRLHIQNDGNIGIGTTNPQRQLHIEGSGTFDAAIQLTNTQGPPLSSWVIAANNGFNQLVFSDRVNNVGRMFITGDGNVGIGDNRPAANLEVVDDLMVSSVSGGLNGDLFTVQSSGNVGVGTTSPGELLSLYKAGGQTRIGLDHDANQFTGISFQTANTEDWFVGYRPNDTTLHFIRPGNDPKVSVTTAGNVGIGTTNPWLKLNVYDSGSDKVLASFQSGGGYAEIQVDNGTVNNQFTALPSGAYLGSNTSHPLFLATNDITRMTVDIIGNVGIGTTGPTAQLHTTGSVRLANFGAGILTNGC